MILIVNITTQTLATDSKINRRRIIHPRTSLDRRRTNKKLLTKKRTMINKKASPKGSMKRLLTLLTMIAFLHWSEMVVKIDLIASVDILSSSKILN
jgi:hypothetical protein